MSATEIRVEAVPGASREKMEKLPDGRFRIAVREDAQGGAANARIRALLARELNLDVRHLRLRTGVRSRHKRFDVILGEY